MDTLITPAAALLQIMEKLRTQKDDLPTLNAIVSTLGVENRNPMSLARSMVELDELIDQAKKAVSLHVDGEQDIYLEPFVTIERFFSDLSLTSPWLAHKSQITPLMIQGLKYADHYLKQSIIANKTPNALEAATLSSKLDSLIEECLACDLNPELRNFFADTLNKLRTALNEYRIFGDSALEAVLDQVAGSINRRSREIKENSQETRGFLSKLFETIGQINDLVAAHDNVAKAIASSGAVYFLPHLG